MNFPKKKLKFRYFNFYKIFWFNIKYSKSFYLFDKKKFNENAKSTKIRIRNNSKKGQKIP